MRRSSACERPVRTVGGWDQISRVARDAGRCGVRGNVGVRQQVERGMSANGRDTKGNCKVSSRSILLFLLGSKYNCATIKWLLRAVCCPFSTVSRSMLRPRFVV